MMTQLLSDNKVSSNKVSSNKVSSNKVSSMVIGDNIPDGATVTPVDDYTIWLRCAELPNTYGSLANVLANSATMTILMSSENAVAYMVRSITNTSGKILYEVVNSETAMEALDTSSIALTGAFDTEAWFDAMMGSSTAVGVLDATATKVPTMTSNSTPSGVASANSEYPTGLAYNAFDGNDATLWTPNNLPRAQWSNCWHKYEFPDALSVYKIDIILATNYANAVTMEYKMQYSEDDTNWYDCTDVESKDIAANNDTKSTIFFDYGVPMANYYRFVGVSQSAGTYCGGIWTLQYYGKELA
jgi:hypothetical protein